MKSFIVLCTYSEGSMLKLFVYFLCTVTTTNNTTAVTTDSIIDSEIYLKRNNQITQNTRIYRKSHCAPGSSSTLSNSPLLHPSFDQKSNRQCLLIKTGAGTKTNRKPAPPPRMSPLKSSSFTLPSTFTNSINVLSGLKYVLVFF